MAKAGLPGEVFVWHDIMYEGPRHPGWPDEHILNARAAFLEEATAGGLDKQRVLETLRNQHPADRSDSGFVRYLAWTGRKMAQRLPQIHAEVNRSCLRSTRVAV